ncbi:Ig-like domain-containing protein [Nonomuraea sp. NPDC050556]|uniref:Ig-like domain-containing protein n=1 Tax=Nonomuraea sp. NPDC050556 TaxID=3364369 RepID=UPI0037A5F674
MHHPYLRALGALTAGLIVLAGGVAQAQERDTSWTVTECDARGTLDDGTGVTVRVENCRPGAFALSNAFTMSWTGFDNDWYTPDIPRDAKVPSLDNYRNSTGRVVVEFSRPVVNPVLHLADLGGANTNGGPNPSRYAQRWKLATPGVTLSKVSGNKQLTVTSDTIQIADVSLVDQSTAGRQGDCDDVDKDGLSYACGSVQLGGTVTRAAFDVDLRVAQGCCAVARETVSFTVTNAANTPPAAPSGVFGGPVGSPLPGKITAEDSDGGPVTVTVLDPSKLPPGVTIGADGTVSGTPTQKGTYQVPIKACDGQGACTTGSAAFVIHECPPAEQPDPYATPN